MLQEPPPSQGELHFSLFGIPVRIHPMFWLVTVILGMGGTRKEDAIPFLLMWIVAVFISILWHEMGHALVIRSFGFRTWVTLYGMGGLASYNPGENPRSRGLSSWGQVLISIAGPGAGFLLAGLILGSLYATGHGNAIVFTSPFQLRPYVFLDNHRLSMLLNDIFFICVLWGLVNLLPIYPLDGGHIAREIILFFNRAEGIRISLIVSMITAVSFGIYAGVQWKDFYVLMFFGFIAYENYMYLQAFSGRGR